MKGVSHPFKQDFSLWVLERVAHKALLPRASRITGVFRSERPPDRKTPVIRRRMSRNTIQPGCTPGIEQTENCISHVYPAKRDEQHTAHGTVGATDGAVARSTGCGYHGGPHVRPAVPRTGSPSNKRPFLDIRGCPARRGEMCPTIPSSNQCEIARPPWSNRTGSWGRVASPSDGLAAGLAHPEVFPPGGYQPGARRSETPTTR